MPKRTVSSQWQFWQREVLEILGTTHSAFTRGATPTAPWFLVPHEELPKARIRDLFLTVREYLLGPNLNQPVTYAVERIDTLKPTESLPLLYAMRHVARDQGSIGRYWPVFRSEILAGCLNLDDVRMRLAPELAGVWILLYLHTGTALYYPREGRRFIKWPLAHAGLLSDDEYVLRHFGKPLVSAYGESPTEAPLLPDNLDEFLAFFSQWLRGPGKPFRTSQLGRLLGSDASNVTVGELAQQWIRENWASVAAEGDPSIAYDMPTLLRPPLRYDPIRHRLKVILRESRWKSARNVELHWGNLNLRLHTSHVKSEDETLCRASEIPVRAPNWIQKAELTDGIESRPIRMPRPPGNIGLVFRTDSGIAIRQWHLGEEYYVLIAKQHLDGAAADVVFEEWLRLGPPEGDWDAYELLWVRIKDPLQQFDSIPDAETLRSILNAYENATDSLNLPSFGHISNTRLYLIGGSRLSEAYSEDVYAVDSPPIWVEIRGVWTERFTLSLSKWCNDVDSYTVHSEIRLPPLNLNETHLVDIWGNSDAGTGLYRLEVSSRRHISFHLVVPSVQARESSFEVSLSVEDEMGLHRDIPILRDLDRGTLVARAWPLAELSLTGDWRLGTSTVSLHIDESGLWKKRWRDLGIGRILEGRVDVTLSWRGMIHSHLTFASTPFIAEGDLKLRWVGHKCKDLEVSAKVSNGNQESRAWIIVVGSHPWKGQIWRETVQLDQNGQFRVQLSVDKNNAQWLIVLPHAMMDEGGHPWCIENLRPNPISGSCSLEILRDGQWAYWNDLASQLRGFSLPHGLSEILNLYTLGEFLHEHAGRLSLPAKWTTIGSLEVLRIFAQWEPLGFNPSMVLLHTRESALAITVDELMPPFLTIESLDKLKNASRGEQVTVACVGTEWSVTDIESTLSTVHLGKEIKTEVQVATSEFIYCCSKCGLALPSNLFASHVPPNEGECATRGGEAFVSCPPGSRELLHVGILIDPAMILSVITALIRKLASENAEQTIPPNAVYWLEQLDDVYNEQGQQTHQWIEDLTDTAQALWTASTSDREPSLIELARRVAKYKDGLGILYKWLSVEYQNATT